MSETRKVGRPSRKVQLDFNCIEDTIEDVLEICNNQKTKDLVIEFCQNLRNILFNETVDERLESLSDLKDDDISYIVHNLF